MTIKDSEDNHAVYGTRERMESGRWHLPGSDELRTEQLRGFRLIKQFNDLGNTEPHAAEAILRELLPEESAVPGWFAPANVEYGYNLICGDNVFINFGATFLAQSKIRLGAGTLVGPHCSFITVGHPIDDATMRAAGWEIAHPITVGTNCWFGAHVTVLPGVTIGDNCVIGAGTLVTKDVPDNSLVLGSPGGSCVSLDDMFDIARIGRDLPVAGVIDRLPTLVDATGRLVIQAPPGTGKTTLVPPALANHCGGKVIVTAPRRVVVRAAARRLRHLSGAPKAVGFSVKGEHQPGTHVEFVTPGVLLQRLLRDPDLEGISAVAIDEVHERQLDTDLILGMCLELAELRDDFRLVAMSATLERDKLTEFLGAETLSTPAVTYPLDISYRPHPDRSSCSREFLDHLAQLAQEQVSATGHSALVFVPGVREVEHVVGRLPGSFPLHGRLDSRQQDAALQPSSTPRIVVSTSLAESSLTVPGVCTVIDSGLSRVPRLDASRGMTGLVTISSAKSTADQRAGRAGREGPGTVVRAYSAADYEHAAEAITPEILTTDLTQAALQLAAWGDCPLLDSPQPQHLTRAREHLESLGALRGGHLTQLGKRLVRLPLDPHLGRALIECGPSAAATVAVLADDPRGDIARQRAPKSESQRLAELVSTGSGVSDPGAITGLAFPRWIARRVNDDTYLLASGTRARLPHDLGLDGSEWLATAVVTRSAEGGTIRAAARISEEDALDIIGVTEELETDFVKGKLRARQIRRAGQIELSSTPTQPSPEAAAEALARLLERTGLEIFHFSDKAQRLFDRLAFLHARLGDPWPDPQKADPQYWLGPELGDIVRGKPPREVDMYPALQRLLPWPNDIDAAAPERLTVPSGKHPRIDYATGRPVVRVKLQECFGLHSSPAIAGLPVQFHLLSPAGRPLAVTDDLASFWSGPYQQVRAEMRGRYPKHAWPEDPA